MLGAHPLMSALTSYYRLAGETAPPNLNASFSPDGLIVTENKRDESVAGIDPAQYICESLVKCTCMLVVHVQTVCL